MAKAHFHCFDIETLLDSLDSAAFLLSVGEDGALRFHMLNRAHVAASGISPEAIVGKTPHECLPSRVADTVMENYRVCQDTNSTYQYEELLNLGGREIWWETTLTPLNDPDGTLIGIMGIANDITDRKSREFEAAKASTFLEKMNENVALLTSMAAHDVRAPLNKINTLTDYVLDGFKDLGDSKREMIEMTRQIATDSLEYVEVILSYAKALGTKMNQLSVCHLSHLCDDIVALVDPEAELSVTKISGSVECETPVLQMIIRNLTENAARQAKGRFAILQRGEDPATGLIHFTVADDGDGFAGGPEGFKEVIELRNISTANRGFGLGAVAQLVETRGGDLWLDEPYFETGAAISFSIPGRYVCETLGAAETALDPVRSVA